MEFIDDNNDHVGESPNSCPSDHSFPSSPDFSKLNFDSHKNDFLEKSDPEKETPPTTDMFGFSVAPVLPYFMMAPGFDCPPPKVPVCCLGIGRKLASLCNYCESKSHFLLPHRLSDRNKS